MATLATAQERAEQLFAFFAGRGIPPFDGAGRLSAEDKARVIDGIGLAIRAAVEGEREACAKAAEDFVNAWEESQHFHRGHFREVAASIRGRPPP